MRSRRERGREGESRVSLDDTAAADSREREPLWELLRMEWDGGLGEGAQCSCGQRGSSCTNLTDQAFWNSDRDGMLRGSAVKKYCTIRK